MFLTLSQYRVFFFSVHKISATARIKTYFVVVMNE